MPIRTAIWKVTTPPEPLVESSLPNERVLEEMIVAAPRLLSEEWMLIGRQEDTGLGGRVDLLAVAPDGAVVLIELKRDRTPRTEEIRPLDREQVRVFLEAVSGDRLEALYVVAITAGVRAGELLGLRWEDVDLEAGMLQVRRTLSEARSGRIFEVPKSGKGRSIRLSKRASAALRSHRKRQIEEKLRLGSLWQENGLVFPSQVGTPIGGRNLIRHFKIRLKRAGLSSTFRFHDLRHTCATLLLKQGVHVKFVQELLGHGDVSLTLNTYSHVLPDMGDVAAGAMDDALG